MKLQDAAAIVIGAGKGTGHAITLAIAKEGADMTIVALQALRIAENTAKEVAILQSCGTGRNGQRCGFLGIRRF